MPDPSPFKLTPTRIFLLVFFGLALALAISTITGSLRGWSEKDAAPAVAGQATP